MIQEYVPGKQVTLAHVIANPEPALCEKLGVAKQVEGALGILTITPSEAAIIAADVSSKAANVGIVFMDRFSGSLVLCGGVSDVEAALADVLQVLCSRMGFSAPMVTRT